MGVSSNVGAADGDMAIVNMPENGAMPTVIEVGNAPEGAVTLETGDGLRVELTAAPERDGEILTVRTSILFGGVHRLTVGSEVLEFEVPGCSPAAVSARLAKGSGDGAARSSMWRLVSSSRSPSSLVGG